MNKETELKIVLLDDEKLVLEAEAELLSETEYTIAGFISPQEAIEYIRANADSIVYVISDLMMPQIDGFDFREQVSKICRDMPFAFLSGNFTIDLAKKAMAMKVSAVLEKPISQQELLRAIKDGLAERKRTIEEKAIIKDIFVNETKQILEELEPLVLSLEENPQDQTLINDIFRLVHTVKGSSSFLENCALPKYAHHFENLLTDLKSGKVEVTDSTVSICLEALDVIKEMNAVIETGEVRNFNLEELVKVFSGGKIPEKSVSKAKTRVEDGEAAPKRAVKNTERDSLRVPIRTLDEFMELSGEITIVRNVVNKLVKSLEKHYPSNKDLSLVSEMLEEMYKSQSRMVSNVLDMRKIPLFDVFRPFQRMVRDLCKNLSKDVKLRVFGETLRVDTSLAKVIGDCLVHIIRNSMDHGIEAADDRKKAGKSGGGLIDINCFESRDEVVIEVKDDGKGLNLEVIRDKGVERGLISFDEAKQLTDAQITQLIFEPGFSTAAKVTDVSGRGVGMDMVKTSVDAIGGHIDVSTEKGKGSTFQFRLPIPKSVLIISVVLVREAGRVFAFPQDRIEHLLQFDVSRTKDYIREMQQSRFLIRDGKLIPLIRLGNVLQLKNAAETEQTEVNIVVVKDDRVHYAIEVGAILDSEEVVVKPLSNVLSGLTCYAGATLVGVGDVCVIIHYEGIAALSGIEKVSVAETQRSSDQKVIAAGDPERDYVLFRFNHNDTVYSSRCDSIFRLEHIAAADVQNSGRTKVVRYRDHLMPLLDTSALLGFESTVLDFSNPHSEIPVLVVACHDNFLGFCVHEFVDVLFVTEKVDGLIRDRKGIDGNLFLAGVNYPVINLQDLIPSQYIKENEKEEKERSPEKGPLAAVPTLESIEPHTPDDDGIIWVS